MVTPRHLRQRPGGGYVIPDFKGRLVFCDDALQWVRSVGSPCDRFAHACTQVEQLELPHDCCFIRADTLLVTSFTGRVDMVRIAADY